MITRRMIGPVLRPWPFDALAGLDESMRMLDPMRRLFDDFDRSLGIPTLHRVRAAIPRVDLVDEGAELRLYAELPGFAQEDVEITLERNELTLRGRRTTEVPEGHTVHRRERGDLDFTRTFTLPCRVDADRVEATLANGVLQIVMPKASEEQPRQIAIQTA